MYFTTFSQLFVDETQPCTLINANEQSSITSGVSIGFLIKIKAILYTLILLNYLVIALLNPIAGFSLRSFLTWKSEMVDKENYCKVVVNIFLELKNITSTDVGQMTTIGFEKIVLERWQIIREVRGII